MELLIFMSLALIVLVIAGQIMYFLERREQAKWLEWLAEFDRQSKADAKEFIDNLTDEQRESIGLKGREK
jgi:Tfp pilus assembly protein PilW